MSARTDPPGWFTRDPSWRWLVEEGRELPEFRRKDECSEPGCRRPRKTRGMCATHYNRWWWRLRRLGLPLPPLPPRPAPPPPAAIVAEMQAAHAELAKVVGG
ncbi:hypothetical protein BJF79_23605 [Actinomadura sp. CNU-125]|uniref:hypothetical protein n=1 Tax=Actinomadura sp. CNU-125 TaxID=1904961 RepID=UPI0009647BBF|nr:hypothetical protein [Actinomadura sp. CNU-125]OLT11711.1 hypothetical protein BJF79_23605 [Actinomadura sp. CNU-125]